jgi:hypothetical protein
MGQNIHARVEFWAKFWNSFCYITSCNYLAIFVIVVI